MKDRPLHGHDSPDLVDARASDGFATLDEVASHAELEAVVKGYAHLIAP